MYEYHGKETRVLSSSSLFSPKRPFLFLLYTFYQYLLNHEPFEYPFQEANADIIKQALESSGVPSQQQQATEAPLATTQQQQQQQTMPPPPQPQPSATVHYTDHGIMNMNLFVLSWKIILYRVYDCDYFSYLGKENVT